MRLNTEIFSFFNVLGTLKDFYSWHGRQPLHDRLMIQFIDKVLEIEYIQIFRLFPKDVPFRNLLLFFQHKISDEESKIKKFRKK
jgi:hypothetical protein